MIIKIPAERPGKKITNASYCNSESHVYICRLYCINTFYSVHISTVILLIKVIGFAVYLVKCCDIWDTDTDNNLGRLSQSHNFWVLFAYWSAGYLQTCKYVSIKVSGSLVTLCLNSCVCMTCLLSSPKQGGCELGNLSLPCPGRDLSFDLKEKSLCCCMSEAAGELCLTICRDKELQLDIVVRGSFKKSVKSSVLLRWWFAPLECFLSLIINLKCRPPSTDAPVKILKNVPAVCLLTNTLSIRVIVNMYKQLWG